MLFEVRKIGLELENQYPWSYSLFSSNNQEYMQSRSWSKSNKMSNPPLGKLIYGRVKTSCTLTSNIYLLKTDGVLRLWGYTDDSLDLFVSFTIGIANQLVYSHLQLINIITFHIQQGVV